MKDLMEDEFSEIPENLKFALEVFITEQVHKQLEAVRVKKLQEQKQQMLSASKQARRQSRGQHYNQMTDLTDLIVGRTGV